MGIVGSMVMYLGAHQVHAGKLTPGGYVQFTAFLAFMVAPVVQLVAIGTQLTEAMAGMDRTKELMGEREEVSEPTRVKELETIEGDVRFENVGFGYEEDKPVLHGISFESRPG